MNTINKGPILILAATPRNKISLSKFFFKESPFYKNLKDPPRLRYSGWNLLTLDEPKIVDGNFWEVKNGERKTIRIYENGLFIAIANLDNSFLGWAMEDSKINTLALTEYIYEFVYLYQVFLEYFPKIDCIEFAVQIKNGVLEGKKLALSPNKVDTLFFESYQLEKDFYEESIQEIKENKYDPKYVSFDILSIIFRYFKIASDKIPYTLVDDSGEKFVDIESIKNIR